ncbi:MAG: hypothetical protein GY699_11240 [Desulfobacteraceae bacterium]|nr:hypothetical protein [Desulfobacteraceae bacterium]
MKTIYHIFDWVVCSIKLSYKKYHLSLLLILAVAIYMALIPATITLADTNKGKGARSPDSGRWTLEIDGKYTCTAIKANAQHTDTHIGSVSFEMPEVSGKVEGKGGKYKYSVTGQTFGNAYQYSTSGTMTFKGEVIPGLLSFTPQVYLPGGKPFFQPVKTFEMPIYDGATYSMPPENNAQMKCVGHVIYTLRGGPREHYRILVDDRMLLVKSHGVFSGYTYRTGITIQVITEMEVIVEDNKIKKVSGTRRLGRITPTSQPPLAWSVLPIKGKCKDGINYPYVPKLSNNQVSATIQSKSSIKLSAQGGNAGVGMKWTINPKQAKLISPDIQYGRPERFNGTLCQDKSLLKTTWTFPRRRNTIKTTYDTFDHLQILSVTMETTAEGQAPGASSGQPPLTKYFKGDTMP